MRLSLILYGHVARGVWAGIPIVVSSSVAIDVFSHFHAGLSDHWSKRIRFSLL